VLKTKEKNKMVEFEMNNTPLQKI